MNREPVLIDINEWEKFGGGFTADSYYKKGDDSMVLKLYAEFMPPQEGYQELVVSEDVASLGIPTAKTVQFVKAGNRYGAVFERVQKKRSIARIIADEPSRLDEMAQLFAGMLKKLHSTQCNTDKFVDVAELMKNKIENAVFLSETQKKRALEILKETPKAYSCIHGDCHIGNVIMADNHDPMFIDLSDFGYGNPLFDLGTSYFMAYCCPDSLCFHLYHIHLDVMQEFWERFIKYYYDGQAPEAVNQMMLPYAGFQAIRFGTKGGENDPVLKNIFKECFGE